MSRIVPLSRRSVKTTRTVCPSPDSPIRTQPIRMLALLERNGQLVEEDGHRLLERDPVLPNVRAGLRLVPLELADADCAHRADAIMGLRSLRRGTACAVTPLGRRGPAQR
jgi:hypothetical protein